jgi:membrane protein EpsK
MGAAAYGLVPIAGMLTAYASLISQSISAGVNRSLTIALQRNDLHEANSVFSTAFFSYLIIGLIQTPIFVLIVVYADVIVDIPQELRRDMTLLMTCSALAFLCNFVTSVFIAPIYANNRLDISQGLEAARCFLRVLGILALFSFFGAALRYVGYVDLGLSLFIAVIQIVASKKLVPALCLRLRNYDWSAVRLIVTTGGWILVNQMGSLLFLRIDVWVCNRFVSPETAGEYASVLQCPTLIRYCGTVISAIIAPMVVIYFAKSEMERLTRLAKMGVKLLSLLLAVPIGLICSFGAPILSLWLGPEFGRLAPLLAILMFHLVINIGIMPLFNVQVAMNKLKVPAIVTFIMGGANLFFAIIFAKLWGVYGIAIAGALVLTARNVLFTSIYTAVILSIPWRSFLRPNFAGLILLAVMMLIGAAVNSWAPPTTWLGLIFASSCLGLIGVAAIWLLLSSEDRKMVFSLIPGRK